MIESQMDKKIKVFWTDNGIEFCNKEFNRFGEDIGIVKQRTIKFTPQQNGVAKRMNMTLLEKVRCIMSGLGLGKSFWVEAVVTTAFLVNRSFNTAIDRKTLEDMWSGNKPNLSNLKTFGCAAYAHQMGGKLDAKSIKCVFML